MSLVSFFQRMLENPLDLRRFLQGERDADALAGRSAVEVREAFDLARQYGSPDTVRELEYGLNRMYPVSGASNVADASATTLTGDADAVGNQSTTNIGQSQSAGRGGTVIGAQNADVDNVGVARANTGGNVTIGGRVNQAAVNDQDAVALGGRGSRRWHRHPADRAHRGRRRPGR